LAWKKRCPPALAANIPSLSDPDEVSNQIFFYLLNQIHDSEVAEVLKQLYEQSYGMSKTWIKEGQENYVISKDIIADFTAELFTAYLWASSEKYDFRKYQNGCFIRVHKRLLEQE
jgi:hypothetical protein